MASPLLIMGVSLPAGYGPLYGLWASLPVGLRVTGLSLRGLLASLFAGYRPLFSRVAGLSLCGLWASLPCGLWAFFLRVTGVSTGYGPLYGLWASLRVMGLSPLRVMGISLYGLLASLPAGYGHLSPAGYGRSPCGLRASLRVAGVSTGCWPCSLYGLQLRICQYRNSDARLYGWLASLSSLVADLPAPQPWRDTWRLYGSWTSLSLSTDYGLLNGLRASQRITGFSTRYGRLCGRRTSLRATDVSAGDGRLCGRRASIRVAGIALYLLRLRICQYRNALYDLRASLTPCGVWASLVYYYAYYYVLPIPCLLR
jgi:hypothetical protein